MTLDILNLVKTVGCQCQSCMLNVTQNILNLVKNNLHASARQ